MQLIQIIALTAAAALPVIAAAQSRTSEPFRAEHREIKEHLGHIDTMLGKLPGKPAGDQQRDMRFIVEFFEKHIAPHAEAEERGLYPAVDELAGTTGQPFTASMRYEHRIVGRWIGELRREMTSAKPDAVRFARQGDKLLGLLYAHFEEEEEVLLPLVDARMTAEEFQRKVIDRTGAAHKH